MQNVRFRQTDLIALAGPTLLLLLAPAGLLLGSGWFVATVAWLIFVAFGLLAVIARGVYPNRSTTLLARFWPVPVVVFMHSTLNPVIDLLNPTLKDGYLLQADERLLGGHPSIWVEQFLSPVFFDVLMVAYASFYIWPLALAVVLHLKGRHREMDSLFSLFLLAFYLNFALYIAVPVIGPRFILMHEYAAEPQGWLVGTQLFNAFLNTPMIRDCFPSGHTTVTLLVLWRSRRLAPTFFWVFLPVGILIVLATVLCRFHYTLDLAAALPFALAVVALWQFMQHRLPHTVYIDLYSMPAQALKWRRE